MRRALVGLFSGVVACAQTQHPRSLSPGSAVCVNPPLNLTHWRSKWPTPQVTWPRAFVKPALLQDRLKRWILEKLFRLLRRLFRSSAIPTVGKYFVYALIGIAGLALLYLAYRSIFQNPEFEEIVPKDLPISAKEWTLWLSEARAAAAKGDWRDAVHLAYWAGISFLEREGFWKPDRARTPREYLRLISAQSEQRETLTALTRIFELSWYAKRDASAQTFSQTLEQLEKLGCR